MLNDIFRTEKPIVAMVHLQYRGSMEQLVKEALRDAGRLERGGVDGLLFENWNWLAEEKETKARMLSVINEAKKATSLPHGVNLLPLDFRLDLEIAKETSAKFVQLDTFVDRVKTDYEGSPVLKVTPGEVVVQRAKLGLYRVVLLTNIQTKHYVTLPTNKKLETSAIQAIDNHADVLVVTGRVTGEKTPKEKLIRVKKVAGDTPVFIGSGFDKDNAEELLPHADGVIVGTSLKYQGVTENPVDVERVKQLMAVVRTLRK